MVKKNSRPTQAAYRNLKSHDKPINKVLQSLESAKKTGPDKWMAICPAHDDKRPSLAIREADDHKVLIYCHAGCAVHDILGALNLELSDLFPETGRALKQHGTGPMRKPFDYRDALTGISTEAITVRFIAGALARGETLDDSAINRLAVAEQRISDALSHAGGAKC